MIPKHYSLVKEHPNSYEIHDSRDNKSFHIAKSGIDLDMHGKLAGIQKFAGGGEAQDQTLGSIIGYPGSPKPEPKPKNFYEGGVTAPSSEPAPENTIALEDTQPVQGQPIPEPDPVVAQSPQIGPPNNPAGAAIPGDGAPTANVPMDASPASTLVAHKQIGLDDVEAGVLKAKKTEEESQQGIQKTWSDFQKTTKEMKTAEQIMQSQKVADDVFAKDLRDHKIDPNHLWASADTGQKIAAGLGLILGGLGAGMTGGPNLALQEINRAIDRDIDAQKEERSKKMTLWKMNREATHNDLEANLHTRNQLLTAVEAQTRMYMARSGSAEVAMKFAPLMMDIKRQKDENYIRMGVIKGDQSEIDPAKLVPILVKDPTDRQKVFGEIQAAQNTVKMAGSIMKAFEEAVKENTVMRTGAGLLRTPGSVYALHQHMQPTFADLEGTVRQAAMDNTFHNITPAPGDSDHKIEQKRDALQEYLQSKSSAPVASANNIDLRKFTSTRPVLGAVTPEERVTKDNKIALFNPKTKQFMGYKK